MEQLEKIVTSGVIIPSIGEVQTYLAEHPDMADLTLDICQLVKGRFSEPGVDVRLRVYHDPQPGCTDHYLVVTVPLEKFRFDLQSRMDLGKEYLDKLNGKSGWIEVCSEEEALVGVREK